MMRAIVVTRFQDKNTKALHEIGDTIDITDKRFDEINSASYRVFVEAIEDPEIDYRSYTKKELISMAEDKGVEVNPKMNKAEIVKELMK